MNHEPECPSPGCDYSTCASYAECPHKCVCKLLRAAYKRGYSQGFKQPAVSDIAIMTIGLFIGMFVSYIACIGL